LSSLNLHEAILYLGFRVYGTGLWVIGTFKRDTENIYFLRLYVGFVLD